MAPRGGRERPFDRPPYGCESVPGFEALALLQELEPLLRNKILVDVANAVEVGADGFALALRYPSSSLAEELPRALPQTSVVNTLNTLNDRVMANPTAAAGPLGLSVVR